LHGVMTMVGVGKKYLSYIVVLRRNGNKRVLQPELTGKLLKRAPGHWKWTLIL